MNRRNKLKSKMKTSTPLAASAVEEPIAEPLFEPTNSNDLSEKLLSAGGQEAVIGDEELQNISWTRGEKQPSVCQDGIWAFLFLLQLVLVGSLGIVWGSGGSWPPNDSTSHFQFSGFAILILWTSLGASAISSLALFVMTRWAAELIQISIIFNICVSLSFAILCLVQNVMAGAITGLIIFAIGILYARAVWPLIPWAASNLETAMTAIKTNLGVTIVGFGMIVLTIGFTMVWLLAIVGTNMHSTTCSEDGQCESHLNGITLALFLLSFYWTIQVTKNLLHVTIAGVVGTWWFAPHEARSCCSSSVIDSFIRASTTSFGSICLGSLLVAMIQVLHQLVHDARRNGRGNNLLLCILECLINILQSLMEYFNKWAFVYVGLYGYSYLEAGPKVMALLSDRGWSAILNDQLVYRVLSWMSFIMGSLSGLVGVLVVTVHPSLLRGVDSDAQLWVAFSVGLVIGSVLCNILLSIIASAVDTVVVCFAEAPLEFRHSYPELSENMEQAWRQIFPTEYRTITDSTLV